MVKIHKKIKCYDRQTYGPIKPGTQEEINEVTQVVGNAIYNETKKSNIITDGTNWLDLNHATSYLNNMSLQQPSLGVEGSEIIYSGGSMFMEIEAEGGGDIYFWLNNKMLKLDCTTYSGSTSGKARVLLHEGIETHPTCQTIYVDLNHYYVTIKSTEGIPSGAYLPIAYLTLQDSGSTQTNGPLRIQRTTECLSHNNQGAISRMRENTRLAGIGEWWNGVEPSLVISATTIDFETTAGVVYQMNRQNWYATKLSEDGAFLVNQKDRINDFTKYTDFANITKDGLNQTIATDDYIIIDIMGGINNNETNNKIFFSVSEKYNSTDIEFSKNSKFMRPSHCLRTVLFPLARIILKKTATGFENYFEITKSIWNFVPQVFKSTNFPINYPNNDDVETIYSGDTSRIRVSFDNFITEKGYDGVTVKDEGGSVLKSYSGSLGAFTEDFNVNYLKLIFTSDADVTFSGVYSSGYYLYDSLVLYHNKLIDMRS